MGDFPQVAHVTKDISNSSLLFSKDATLQFQLQVRSQFAIV
jgi:hypothetical protein